MRKPKLGSGTVKSGKNEAAPPRLGEARLRGDGPLAVARRSLRLLLR